LRGRSRLRLLLGLKVCRLQWRRLAPGRLVAFLATLQSVFHPFAHKGLVTYWWASEQLGRRHVVGCCLSVVSLVKGTPTSMPTTSFETSFIPQGEF
jgi:hypothetical protein